MFRPTRRWLRYSLRTLLVALTALCLWLGWQAQLVHERRQMARRFEAIWGPSKPAASDRWPDPRPLYLPEDRLPFWRRWMGDRAFVDVALIDERAFTPSEIARMRGIFP